MPCLLSVPRPSVLPGSLCCVDVVSGPASVALGRGVCVHVTGPSAPTAAVLASEAACDPGEQWISGVLASLSSLCRWEGKGLSGRTSGLSHRTLAGRSPGPCGLSQATGSVAVIECWRVSRPLEAMTAVRRLSVRDVASRGFLQMLTPPPVGAVPPPFPVWVFPCLHLRHMD